MKALTYKEVEARNKDTYLEATNNPLVQLDPITEDYEILFEDGSWIQICGPHRKEIADTIASKL